MPPAGVVLIEAVLNRGNGSFLDVRRRIEVRLADGEIYHVDARPQHCFGLGIHCHGR